MHRQLWMTAITLCFVAWSFISAFAQQPAAPQPPQELPRIEAKKEVVVNWTLGDQSWVFKDIATAYEPVKGYMEPRGNQGFLAVWTLRLVHDLEEGAARLHEETRGSPFKIMLLDADRTVIDSDLPAQITPVSGKAGDTIELLVGLKYDESVLKDAKVIRVSRRTNVGF
jgi:hypothetical protein